MPDPLRVLILEDNPSDAELMVHELRRAGFDPTWTRVDTKAAFLAALEDAPDVILADHSLPEYDVFRALDHLRERDLDIPCLVITGNVGDELAAECIKRGACDYLLKDRLARLGGAVLAALEQRRLGVEKRRAEVALALRTTQLEAVQAITAEMTRELNLPRLLDLIIRRAVGLLGAVSGTVCLWETASEELVPQAWVGLGDWRRDLRRRLGEGVAGQVAEGRAGMIINDYQASPLADPAYLERTAVAAILAEPLLYHDRLVGVIAVDREAAGGPFAPQDRELLGLFAAEAAIAIENARLFEEVRSAHARLEALSRRLVETQEAERRHIARELHDEIGQSLTALKLLLDVSGTVGSEQWKNTQAEIHDLVNGVLGQVRELSLDLRPAMLDDLGLVLALVWLYERFQSRTGIKVLFAHTGVERLRFPAAVETAAYRVVQEALTNVARHAQVGDVAVRLWTATDTLGVQVADQGVGFDPEAALAAHSSSGLAGMRERAELLGGRMDVESAPGAGTCVTAEFPLGPPGAGAGEDPGGQSPLR